MTLYWWFCRYPVIVQRQFWMVLWNIDHCILCWICYWVKCWMLQDRDHKKASCILYVKVSTFDQVKQNKIWVSTMGSLEIVMLTVQHELICNVCFIYNPGDVMRGIYPGVISVEESTVYLSLWLDIRCWLQLFISVNTKWKSNWLTPHSRTMGSCETCSYTWRSIYIPQDFITKKQNWFLKMDPTHRCFSTFSTDHPSRWFGIFHHPSKSSSILSRCHDISKTCLVI